MKKIIFTIAAILFIVTSCKKHTILDPSDRTLKIGNIYCDDGSVVDPVTYKETDQNNAVGVIFWVNSVDSTQNKALVVSLDNISGNLQWMDTLADVKVSSSITAFDGEENTNIIQTFSLKNEVSAPASENVIRYKYKDVDCWFLPSVGQLVEIYKQKEILYKSFDVCLGQDFDDVWYWSSNQDNAGDESKKYNAMVVSLTEGKIHASRKMDFHSVRPVKAIK